MVQARAAYDTGNVNLHCPLRYSSYPVHCAAVGGNLALLRWLVEEKYCPLTTANRDNRDRAARPWVPLLSATGHSVLGIAAMQGHSEMVRYLVLQRKCSVNEIEDLSLCQRALHAVLGGADPLPPLTIHKKASKRTDDLELYWRAASHWKTAVGDGASSAGAAAGLAAATAGEEEADPRPRSSSRQQQQPQQQPQQPQQQPQQPQQQQQQQQRAAPSPSAPPPPPARSAATGPPTPSAPVVDTAPARRSSPSPSGSPVAPAAPGAVATAQLQLVDLSGSGALASSGGLNVADTGVVRAELFDPNAPQQTTHSRSVFGRRAAAAAAAAAASSNVVAADAVLASDIMFQVVLPYDPNTPDDESVAAASVASSFDLNAPASWGSPAGPQAEGSNIIMATATPYEWPVVPTGTVNGNALPENSFLEVVAADEEGNRRLRQQQSWF